MRSIEDALEVLNALNSQGRIEYAAYSELYDTIAMIETEPVRHGHWEGKPIAGYSTVRCSECGEVFMENRGKWNFCPNCGAQMEVEDAN